MVAVGEVRGERQDVHEVVVVVELLIEPPDRRREIDAGGIRDGHHDVGHVGARLEVPVQELDVDRRNATIGHVDEQVVAHQTRPGPEDVQEAHEVVVGVVGAIAKQRLLVGQGGAEPPTT